MTGTPYRTRRSLRAEEPFSADPWWRAARSRRMAVLTRAVVRFLPPSVWSHQLPSPHRAELRALGRIWAHELRYERVRSRADWQWICSGTPPRQLPWETTQWPRAGGLIGFYQGEAWSTRELIHREIIWHLTQDLPSPAGWEERWDALGVPAGRQIYIRTHFGHQLGLR